MTTNQEFISLKAGEELRVEVGFDQKFWVKLNTGFAECFGAELGKREEYGGEFISKYVASTTPMYMCMNIHLALQSQRISAKELSDKDMLQASPRLLVLGPKDSGKTTLGMVTVPGTISATQFTHSLNPIDGFMSHGIVNDSGGVDHPLVFHYGHLETSDHPFLFRRLVKRLAATVEAQIKLNPSKSMAGIIIDTSGEMPSDYQVEIEDIVELFNVNRILVIENEKFYNTFVKRYEDNQNISIAFMQKSGGVVSRDSKFLHSYRDSTIKKYFHGTDSEKLQSFSTTLKIQDIGLFKFGQESLAPSSTLPLGESRKVTETQVSRVAIDDKILNMMISVLQLDLPEATKSMVDSNEHAEMDEKEQVEVDFNISEDSVLDAPVLGFINVASIDPNKNYVTVLSPSPGRVPSKVMLLSDIQWIETEG
ncbi:hypothetical protein BB560_006203 [Smittium megazygosporum]|uniref:Polynucleotide 5'-hydroxyl-kinase GRC3 n=1 Tax=Smittium megazygosporum TaxID=133381 RepID=A0A2T9YDM1_9FUNG|nr:hypothetical protein BB560_006203 [Smittium megazygosporum]